MTGFLIAHSLLAMSSSHHGTMPGHRHVSGSRQKPAPYSWLSAQLLAVLSGMLGNAIFCLRQASDDDGTKFLCSKAELIDELESSLPSFMRGADW